MSQPVKFTFDQSFDGGARSRYDEEVDELRVELERARAESHAAGVDEGRAQVLKEIEASSLETLLQISAAASALFSQHHELEERLKKEMVQLAYTIASKLAPALMAQTPVGEIENLIKDCLLIAKQEPHLVIRVSENVIDPINDRLESIKKSTGFLGEIILVGSGDLDAQDCQIEWPDGGADRFNSRIQSQIEDAVQRFVIAGGTNAQLSSTKDTATHDPDTDSISTKE